MSALYIPHQKEKVSHYIRRTYSRWRIAFIPVVCSSGMTYTNVVSVPIEEHNIHMHTSSLIPQVAPMYLTLCG
jgi:hypothetical protein